MRYELTDYEWVAIKPFLPNKPRGVPRVDDRRVLNGILWVLRSGAPWRDLPENFGPYTTCYNRFLMRKSSNGCLASLNHNQPNGKKRTSAVLGGATRGLKTKRPPTEAAYSSALTRSASPHVGHA